MAARAIGSRRVLNLVLVGLAAVMMSACSPGIFSTDMSGTWFVTITNQANNNYTGTMEMRINQSGGEIFGSMYVLGIYSGTVSGEVVLNSFSLRYSASSDVGGGYMDFEGDVSGSSLTGWYTASAGGYGPVSGTKSGGASSIGGQQMEMSPAELLFELR